MNINHSPNHPVDCIIVDMSPLADMLFERFMDWFSNVDGMPDFTRLHCREIAYEIFTTLTTHGGNYGYEDIFVLGLLEEELECHRPSNKMLDYLLSECKRFVDYVFQQYSFANYSNFYSSFRHSPTQVKLEFIKQDLTPQHTEFLNIEQVYTGG